MLSSYIGEMQDGSTRRRRKLYGGIAASVALHAVIAGVLLIQLPPLEFSPAEEETVSVEMVPAPEETTPEEKVPEEKPLDLTMPEPKPEEQEQQQPPPPPEAQKPAEAAGGEPPAPAPPQQEEAAGEPPPPPPPPSEASVPEPEAPAEAEPNETPPEQAEAPPPAGEGGTPAMMRPVFEFGKEDAGSAVAKDGSAPTGEEGQSTEAEETADAAPPSAGENSPPADAATGESSGQDEPAGAGGEAAAPSGATLPPDITLPSIDTAEADRPVNEGNGVGAGEGGTGVVAEQAARPGRNAEAADQARAPVAAPTERPLTPARRLYSRTDTQDPMAIAAMQGIPRDVRAGQLCSSELYGQLLNGARAFRPDVVPTLKLAAGNVLEISDAAFRSREEWYDVRFRCEINEEATRIVSFAIDVGETIPRSQWRARGFGGF